MEWLVLGAFCAGLVLCIASGHSILYALGFGLIIFMLYGRHKGFAWRELIRMALNGIRMVRSILVTFFLIGIMTALWRAAGTIPFIVCHAATLIHPSAFLLMTFLLNCGLSVLTGTSFGTAATMGVICASMGAAMQVSPILTGGAVLSGAYFGDRCSPVSTSALLVAALTGTNIYSNIRAMLRSALAPFLAACLIYFLLGRQLSGGGAVMDLEALFSRSFRLSWITLLPAAVIFLLAVLRVNVKLAMGASILTALPICLILQGQPPALLFHAAAMGFTPADAGTSAMISGGGMISMANAACIVCLSSSYTELFSKTGLLDNARQLAAAIARRTSAYAAMLLSSALSGMVACNQTLTILLCHQLCRGAYDDAGQLALDLEDSAVVIAPLVPWSIAGAVPLAAADAPTAAILASFYLILLPLWRLAGSLIEKRRTPKALRRAG